MADVLLHNGAIQIICTKIEGNLGHLHAEHDPVSLDVSKVVEKQPRHCYGFQVSKASSRLHPGYARVGRLKGEGDEGDETTSFILRLPEGQHVVNPLSIGLKMTVKEGGIGANPQLMSLLVYLKPAVTT